MEVQVRPCLIGQTKPQRWEIEIEVGSFGDPGWYLCFLARPDQYSWSTWWSFLHGSINELKDKLENDESPQIERVGGLLLFTSLPAAGGIRAHFSIPESQVIDKLRHVLGRAKEENWHWPCRDD